MSGFEHKAVNREIMSGDGANRPGSEASAQNVADAVEGTPAWLAKFLEFYRQRFGETIAAESIGLEQSAHDAANEPSTNSDSDVPPPWMQAFLAYPVAPESASPVLPAARNSAPAPAVPAPVLSVTPDERKAEQAPDRIALSGPALPESLPQIPDHRLRKRRLIRYVLYLLTVTFMAAASLILYFFRVNGSERAAAMRRASPHALAAPLLSATPPPALARQSPPPSPAQASASHPGNQPGSGTDVLTSIQHSASPHATMVAIAFSGAPGYTVNRISHPERIFVDLSHTRVSPALNGRSFITGESCLAKFRLAAHSPETARVTFETGSLCDYSATLTSNPPRLVFALRPHLSGH